MHNIEESKLIVLEKAFQLDKRMSIYLFGSRIEEVYLDSDIDIALFVPDDMEKVKIEEIRSMLFPKFDLVLIKKSLLEKKLTYNSHYYLSLLSLCHSSVKLYGEDIMIKSPFYDGYALHVKSIFLNLKKVKVLFEKNEFYALMNKILLIHVSLCAIENNDLEFYQSKYEIINNMSESQKIELKTLKGLRNVSIYNKDVFLNHVEEKLTFLINSLRSTLIKKTKKGTPLALKNIEDDFIKDYYNQLDVKSCKSMEKEILDLLEGLISFSK